jgi:hypothetical protein
MDLLNGGLPVRDDTLGQLIANHGSCHSFVDTIMFDEANYDDDNDELIYL